MKGWTLFLDRDGVINKKIDDGYVTNLSEMEILPGVMEALSIFAKYFGHIFIVTNQRGIARGMYTIEDLNGIHQQLLELIKNENGRIDKVYFCPHNNNECDCRKPLTGMALQAQRDFPDVDFSKSVMIGDSSSDMEFGRSLGMKTIRIGADKNDSDMSFDSLIAVAKQLPAA